MVGPDHRVSLSSILSIGVNRGGIGTVRISWDQALEAMVAVLGTVVRRFSWSPQSMRMAVSVPATASLWWTLISLWGL